VAEDWLSREHDWTGKANGMVRHGWIVVAELIPQSFERLMEYGYKTLWVLSHPVYHRANDENIRKKRNPKRKEQILQSSSC
jgi:hypothetical protein